LTAAADKWAIFDLDGTLVDSQPHVLWSVGETARLLGIRQVAAVRIGPPLRDLLREACALQDEGQLAEAMRVFREVHDGNAGAGCKPYADALMLWNALEESGVRMAVATNKREEPARAILEYWKFGSRLPLLACADSARLAGRPGKTQMVAALLAELGARNSRTMMVGDSHEDMLAAQENALGLALFAQWGYGEHRGTGEVVADPRAALAAVKAFYAPTSPVPGYTGRPVAG
jgi:phosphoglycolate phosphatase